jgi:hypothetical protein
MEGVVMTSKITRAKKKSWSQLISSLKKFTPDFMGKGRRQPAAQRRKPQVDAVAKKVRKEMKKAGLTLDEILTDLKRPRARYNKDRYRG